MDYKSLPYLAIMITLLSLTGIAASVGQPLFASELGSDESTEGSVEAPEDYTETQLIAYAIDHLRLALQNYIEGNTEQAEANLAISQEQIAQAQMIQQGAQE